MVRSCFSRISCNTKGQILSLNSHHRIQSLLYPIHLVVVPPQHTKPTGLWRAHAYDHTISLDLLSCTTQRDRDPIAEITVSWISLLQSFVRKDRAQGVDDLRKSCACGRGPHNRIEQREIVNRPQIPGCYHRNACRHQFMGIGFALVAHDITSSR